VAPPAILRGGREQPSASAGGASAEQLWDGAEYPEHVAAEHSGAMCEEDVCELLPEDDYRQVLADRVTVIAHRARRAHRLRQSLQGFREYEAARGRIRRAQAVARRLRHKEPTGYRAVVQLPAGLRWRGNHCRGQRRQVVRRARAPGGADDDGGGPGGDSRRACLRWGNSHAAAGIRTSEAISTSTFSEVGCA